MTQLRVGTELFEDYSSFAGAMQLNLPRIGMQLNNRLYRIIGYVYELEKLRPISDEEQAAVKYLKSNSVLGGWQEFADFLFDRKLISPRETGFVPHRPRNLGARPPWIKPVNDQRPKGQGQAIRHIVPSHLIGYAVENATGRVRDELGSLIGGYAAAYHHWTGEQADVLRLFATTKPALGDTTQREWTARRWAWALLYNHPGNLWVGDADDNQIIGFMYATVCGVLSRMRKMIGPDAPVQNVMSSPRKGVKIKTQEAKPLVDAVDQALATLRPFEEGGTGGLREEIKTVLASAKDPDVDVLSVTDLICFVEDVGANLEFDIPALSDWSLVQDWRAKFSQTKVAAAELAGFLKVQFKGSLSPP